MECAIQLHEEVKIGSIKLKGSRSLPRSRRSGSSTKPDRCIIRRTAITCLYMTAVGLIFGELTADHYEDDVARDPRIDSLSDKMIIIEDARYSEDYLDPEKRSIANAVQVFFKDGSATEKVAVEYPIGHGDAAPKAFPLDKEI